MTPVITQAFDPAACALADLTQHIRETHHTYLRAELPLIWDLLREALAASPAARAEIRAFAQAFGQFRATLDSHLRKEEEILFPFVEQLERTRQAGMPSPRHGFGALALPIEILEAEHALGDRLLDRMRPIWQRWALPGDTPAWQRSLGERLIGLDADMQRHVYVEDAILFPRTIQLEEMPCSSAAGAR
ncbi:MAG: hemerythrin domain-containing protein [Acidobacteria bacterium]|nr:hemerythrin domain-containing protein [Acidobacteriota bacterium]